MDRKALITKLELELRQAFKNFEEGKVFHLKNLIGGYRCALLKREQSIVYNIKYELQ